MIRAPGRWALIALALLVGCRATPVPPSPTTTPTAQPASTVAPPVTATRTASPEATQPAPSATALPTSTPTFTPTPTPQPPAVTLNAYGTVYVLYSSDWSEADRPAIRETLAQMRALGMDTVVQNFSSAHIGTGREVDWLIFLDEAERAGIDVLARLWPVDDFDFGPVAAFLAVVGDHPALRAYLGLHEPLEKYNGDQLRTFYREVKAIAPDVPIANYMGNMALFENSWRFPNRDFTDGICDICIVWCTPARHENGVPSFAAEEVHATVHDNRLLIDARDPAAELWFLGQTYALAAHRQTLRMPTPEEMTQIFTIAVEEGVDGFLWYPWFHGNYDVVLGDPEMDVQRQAVRQIYETYLQR